MANGRPVLCAKSMIGSAACSSQYSIQYAALAGQQQHSISQTCSASSKQAVGLQVTHSAVTVLAAMLTKNHSWHADEIIACQRCFVSCFSLDQSTNIELLTKLKGGLQCWCPYTAHLIRMDPYNYRAVLYDALGQIKMQDIS